jgi:hypothetical protein
MVLALTNYLLGNLPEALRLTEEIRKIDKHHTTVSINNAFFGILQKNYERTKFWYDVLMKQKKLMDVDIFSVVTFLDEEYRNNPSEHAYLYALGVVNGCIDPTTVKANLQRFLRLTSHRTEYEVLRVRARELLKPR